MKNVNTLLGLAICGWYNDATQKFLYQGLRDARFVEKVCTQLQITKEEYESILSGAASCSVEKLQAEYPLISSENFSMIRKCLTLTAPFHGCTNFKGFFLSTDDCYTLAVKLGYTEVFEARGIRGDVFNKNELFSVSWAEGDVSVTLYRNEEEYQRERALVERWYREEYGELVVR